MRPSHVQRFHEASAGTGEGGLGAPRAVCCLCSYHPWDGDSSTPGGSQRPQSCLGPCLCGWCFPDIIYNFFKVLFLPRCFWGKEKKIIHKQTLLELTALAQSAGNGNSCCLCIFFLSLCFSVFLGEAALTIFHLRQEERLGPSNTAALESPQLACNPSTAPFLSLPL